ncbi:MAG: (2Fe-2S)-binding protein [Bacteroidaceae bacterium]|nr:(2Fe-2S)-binding protein [Bacteroidaceae bacterium]MBO7112004.1 (2Fe-2S)-binding protein [Bacteroidaceae bacterium]
MKISVNNQPFEVSGHKPLIEELRAAGIEVPSLCYAGGHVHHASCMVCMVKDVRTGQMLPSCSTMPREGMEIDTDSQEVKELRRMSLELLLSDHRADCEAPCTLVCPKGIDAAQVIWYYDNDMKAQAKALLQGRDCSDCAKTPCMKACRRGTVDRSVDISGIINSLAADDSIHAVSAVSMADTDKETFNSRMGRFTDKEKEQMKLQYAQPSRCLHCACNGRDKCRLRRFSTEVGIKATRYGVSSELPFKQETQVTGHLWFDPAKCIRCGLCVYNTTDGFTFQYRGYRMQVIIPDASRNNVTEEIAQLCPTGALYISKDK